MNPLFVLCEIYIIVWIVICTVLLWLIPHPIVIWLTYGSMECNKDVWCIHMRPHGLSGRLHPEDEGNMFLWNAGNYLQDYTASQPRRPELTFSPSWEPQNLRQFNASSTNILNYLTSVHSTNSVWLIDKTNKTQESKANIQYMTVKCTICYAYYRITILLLFPKQMFRSVWPNLIAHGVKYLNLLRKSST
jgi:hypothetical protein